MKDLLKSLTYQFHPHIPQVPDLFQITDVILFLLMSSTVDYNSVVRHCKHLSPNYLKIIENNLLIAPNPCLPYKYQYLV